MNFSQYFTSMQYTRPKAIPRRGEPQKGQVQPMKQPKNYKRHSRNAMLTLLSTLPVAAGLAYSTMAHAAKPEGSGTGGKFSVTLALVSSAAPAQLGAGAGTATFAVTRSVPSSDVVWITNSCFDAANVEVSRQDTVVLWGMWDSINGTATSPTAGTHCNAHATLRPWTNSVLSDAIVAYSV